MLEDRRMAARRRPDYHSLRVGYVIHRTFAHGIARIDGMEQA